MVAIFIFCFLFVVLIFALSVPLHKDTPDISNEDHKLAVLRIQAVPRITKLNLSKSAHESYVSKMIEQQPRDNDRLLPGGGKNHALEAMVATISLDRTDTLTVLQQVGDVFS